MYLRANLNLIYVLCVNVDYVVKHLPREREGRVIFADYGGEWNEQKRNKNWSASSFLQAYMFGPKNTSFHNLFPTLPFSSFNICHLKNAMMIVRLDAIHTNLNDLFG